MRAQEIYLEHKHLMDMKQDELEKIVCFGYEGHPCSNTMDEYGCRNSMKDNEPFCSECCADTTTDNPNSEVSCCG
jgi:hypothetical protein